MPLTPISYEFDVSAIDPYVNSGGAPLPTGDYLMQITSMEPRHNNNQASGSNLALEYTVLDGEFKGRKYFENLNLWHTNSKDAVEVAQKHLSSIGHAVGITKGGDLTLLAMKPMIVSLELQEATPEEINPNTGDKIPAKRAQNRVMRRSAYTPGQQVANTVAVAPVAQAAAQVAQSAAAAAAAPAFNPAVAAAAPAQQAQAPAFNQAAAAPAPTPVPVQAAQGGAGAAIPPWQKAPV